MKFGQVEALVFVLETFLRLPITKVYLPLLAFEIAHHFLFLLLGAGPYMPFTVSQMPSCSDSVSKTSTAASGTSGPSPWEILEHQGKSWRHMSPSPELCLGQVSLISEGEGKYSTSSCHPPGGSGGNDIPSGPEPLGPAFQPLTEVTCQVQLVAV